MCSVFKKMRPQRKNKNGPKHPQSFQPIPKLLMSFPLKFFLQRLTDHTPKVVCQATGSKVREDVLCGQDSNRSVFFISQC